MKVGLAGIDCVKKSESCRLEAYLDTGGVWTLGWGHTKGVKAGDTCSQEQADAWLATDLVDAELTVIAMVHTRLSQNEFDALVSFVFNIGAHQFAHSTMLKLLNADRFELAALEFRKWRFDNGVEIPGLLARRVREKNLFVTPI